VVVARGRLVIHAGTRTSGSTLQRMCMGPPLRKVNRFARVAWQKRDAAMPGSRRPSATRDVCLIRHPEPIEAAPPELCCTDDQHAPSAERVALIRQAFRLEWLTLAWMSIEAVVAIAAGIAAHSLTLLAFGIDSVIELASAGLLIWRLAVELHHGQAFSEDAERIASRIGGALLFALAAYVIASAGWGLWNRHGQEFSWRGSC